MPHQRNTNKVKNFARKSRLAAIFSAVIAGEGVRDALLRAIAEEGFPNNVLRFLSEEKRAIVLGRNAVALNSKTGSSYDLPSISACPRGHKLCLTAGSVCAGCYACNRDNRLVHVLSREEEAFSLLKDALRTPDGIIAWATAMAVEIECQGLRFFRWHASGDIVCVEHLLALVLVAKWCPNVAFWLPTREYGTLKSAFLGYTAHGVPPMMSGKLPENMAIRLSAAVIDGHAPKGWALTSTVYSLGVAPIGLPCEGQCGPCRACWDKRVKTVAYPYH